MQPHDFTYIFVLGLIFAFLDAFGIGANDVANSFATSVSSKSLTLKQAYLIAVVMEFGGAVLLGAGVGDTIKNKIIKVELFQEKPEVLMLAFLCALMGSSTWVLFASKKGWPVSTTHSIVGAVAGVGIAAFGINTPDWTWNGMGQIIASWFISPAVAGVVASIIYLITKYSVLTAKDSLGRGLNAIAVYVFVTVSVGALYILLKGGAKVSLNASNIGPVLGGTFGAGVGAALLTYFTILPWLRRKLIGRELMKWYHIPVAFFIQKQPENLNLQKELDAFMDHGATNFSKDVEKGEDLATQDSDVSLTDGATEEPTQQSRLARFGAFASKNINRDVVTVRSKHVAKVHNEAIKFDPATEYLFSFTQVLTASFASFAHGSNDVANAIGPLAAIYAIWESGTFSTKTSVPLWTLAFGGGALVLGFIFFGYHVMRSLGNNLTFQSPSRGFSMEMGAALTVLTASFIGLPVSTTHCITGATAAVAVANGNMKSLNWKMLGWCLFSWILTVPVAAVVAGLVFAFANNAPHL